MRVSRAYLLNESESTGFRPEVLEKVFHLLSLLEGFNRHPFLKERVALKGGTALNLFLFDIPRLSVDIDLNYLGATGRDSMLHERPKIEQAIRAVCSREGLEISHSPKDHAGGKWRLRYDSALGAKGNLEVDLNFMFRQTLWPSARKTATVGSYSARHISVLDVHELAAGKIAALLSRQASRDLFDTHQLLTRAALDPEKFRIAFVLYGAMNRRDWRTVSIDDIDYEPQELKHKLYPLLRESEIQEQSPDEWGRRMVTECREALKPVLPLKKNEIAFLDQLLDHGQIEPQRFVKEPDLLQVIESHPMLQWKALNVRKTKP